MYPKLFGANYHLCHPDRAIDYVEESFLAFIGLQVQMGARNLDSWGSLIKYGIDNAGEQYHQWWLVARTCRDDGDYPINA